MGEPTSPQKKDKFLTTGQVAEQCGVNFRTVIRWIQRGYLKAYRLPGVRADHRIPADEFEKFLESFRSGNLAIQASPLKILVVDDDPMIQKSIYRVLSKSGYEVLSSLDGFSAGMAIREHRPDIVILDLKMKGINGLMVLKSIRDSSELKATKVLVISGDTQAKINEALRMGADAALSKPFRNQELLLKVDGLIGKEVPNDKQTSAGSRR